MKQFVTFVTKRVTTTKRQGQRTSQVAILLSSIFCCCVRWPHNNAKCALTRNTHARRQTANTTMDMMPGAQAFNVSPEIIFIVSATNRDKHLSTACGVLCTAVAAAVASSRSRTCKHKSPPPPLAPVLVCSSAGRHKRVACSIIIERHKLCACGAVRCGFGCYVSSCCRAFDVWSSGSVSPACGIHTLLHPPYSSSDV